MRGHSAIVPRRHAIRSLFRTAIESRRPRDR
jgi:hypothetical protein